MTATPIRLYVPQDATNVQTDPSPLLKAFRSTTGLPEAFAGKCYLLKRDRSRAPRDHTRANLEDMGVHCDDLYITTRQERKEEALVRFTYLMDTEKARKLPFLTWIIAAISEETKASSHQVWNNLKWGAYSDTLLALCLKKIRDFGEVSISELKTLVGLSGYVLPVSLAHKKELPEGNGMVSEKILKILMKSA